MSQNDCEAALEAMTEDRDLWKDDHDGDCPYVEQVTQLEQQLSEARQERDRQYEFNIGQIATQAALEQQLSEAREERDEFRERLKSMREANASLVEQRAVSTLQVAQRAATISQLRGALEKAKHGLETAGMGARYIDQALAKL